MEAVGSQTRPYVLDAQGGRYLEDMGRKIGPPPPAVAEALAWLTALAMAG